MIGALEVAVKLMAKLGGKHPLLALPAQVLADQRFGVVIAVAFGGIDQIDAQLFGALQDRISHLLGELHPPLAAVLPRSDANHRHFDAGAA